MDVSSYGYRYPYGAALYNLHVYDKITHPLKSSKLQPLDQWFHSTVTGHVITYLCWDLSKSMLVKWTPGVVTYMYRL